MKLFKVERTDEIGWDEDYEMLVVAEDELKAIDAAREESYSFEQCGYFNIKATEIDMTASGVVSVLTKIG